MENFLRTCMKQWHMDTARAPAGTVGGQPGNLLSDEDVLTCLLREEAVHKDVQEKLAR